MNRLRNGGLFEPFLHTFLETAIQQAFLREYPTVHCVYNLMVEQTHTTFCHLCRNLTLISTSNVKMMYEKARLDTTEVSQYVFLFVSTHHISLPPTFFRSFVPPPSFDPPSPRSHPTSPSLAPFVPPSLFSLSCSTHHFLRAHRGCDISATPPPPHNTLLPPFFLEGAWVRCRC